MNQTVTTPALTEDGAQNIEQLFEGFSFEEIVAEMVNGTFAPDGGGVLGRILSLFLGELKIAFALVGSIGALLLISTLINNLTGAFEKKSVGDAASFAIFVYIATIGATAFEKASGYVLSTLRDITIFVHSIIPAMATLCISGGEVVRASLSHPVIFFVCSAAATIIKNVITPLVLFRAVCVLLCAITQNTGLGEFTELFSKIHKTVLGFSMSIFAGILGISAFAASGFDNLAARGVKFAISAAVPVVGGSISEAMSSVATSAALLKNAVGLTGVIMLFAMFAVPLLKIAALSFAFRITAAFTAPVTEKRTTETIRKLGDCIDMLFSSVACMGTVMIIAVASIL